MTMILKMMLLMVLIAVGLFSCQPRVIKPFPDTDIIYQATDDTGEGTEPFNAVGFVNLDGSGNTIVPTNIRAQLPVPLVRGELLSYYDPAYNPYLITPEWGSVYFYSKKHGEDRCADKDVITSWFVYPLPGTDSLLLTYPFAIVLMKAGTCEIEQTLLSYPGGIGPTEFYEAASPSWQGDRIVFSDYSSKEDSYRVKILDLTSGEITTLRDGGIYGGTNPSFSPNGKEVAYLWMGGIHVINVETLQDRLVVEMDKQSTVNGPAPAAPVWSADGNWLVYHKCVAGECQVRADFAIYKVDLKTNTETLLAQGGLYPQMQIEYRD